MAYSITHAQLKQRVFDANHSTKVDVNKKFKVKKNIFDPAKKVNETSVVGSQFRSLDGNGLQVAKFNVKHVTDNDIIQWVSGRVPQRAEDTWDIKAQTWFSSVSQLLKLNTELTDFLPREVWKDDLGQSHMRMDQYHNGIRVYNAEVILHAENDIIVSQNGEYVKSELLPTEKSDVIEASVIQDQIESSLSNYNPNWNVLKGIGYKFDVEQLEQELVYYGEGGEDYRLAYYITVHPNMGEHLEYIVDATDGKILVERSLICKFHNHDNLDHSSCMGHNRDETKNVLLDGEATANATDLLGANRNINTYDVSDDFFLIDASRDMFNPSASTFPNNPEGVVWTIDMRNGSPSNDADYFHVVSSNNQWGNSPEGVSAHFNAGTAYEYFKFVHGRESISGDGQNIISFVNVANPDGTSMGNAFWNGLGIFYGNGDSQFLPLGRGLDVAGHEMTHGVVQATANLEYQGESGALNESFADIFGAMIDREDWLIGEDVIRGGGALRNMEDPHNGAATGNFGGGWQPDNYNERFLGPEDNGGVHINSGITNRAFFLFATATSRATAERVYYRALTTYLTRSSQFRELRNAVLQSASDLFGNDPNVANQAAISFDRVGIVQEGSVDFEQDIDVNPGDDLLLYADNALSNLFLINITQQEFVFNPLTTTNIHSRPSVTDDGENIVFVGEDRRVHLINIDWDAANPTVDESILIDDPVWDNIIVSKDASRLAGTFSLVDPESDPQNRSIWVFDFAQQAQQVFELFNPTFTEGVETGNVLFPDAIEFDFTGNTVMYDAFNRVNGSNAGTIEFWDIGFLEVWNPSANTWALGNIEKLFGSLPEGISVGNPTFAKNSPFIIALDFIEDGLNQILGVNIESGEIGTLFENQGLGFPSYSNNDQFLIYDLVLFEPTELGILELQDSKIDPVANSDNFFFQNQIDSRLGIWFSNGNRVLTSVEEIVDSEGVLSINPNPASDFLNIELSEDIFIGDVTMEVVDAHGKLVDTRSFRSSELLSYNYQVSALESGIYILTFRDNEKIINKKFIKQ
jgi:Zn-dependent metalloprotease